MKKERKIVKKMLVFLTILLIGFVSNAMADISWRTANQMTIGWDAVTTIDDGTAIPEGSTIEYKIFLSNAMTDPGKTNPVQIAQITGNEYTVTLNIEGRYVVGIQTIRKIGNEIVSESIMSWSDMIDVTENGVAFGAQYFKNPANAKGLKSR